MYCKFLENKIIAMNIFHTNLSLMAFQSASLDEARAAMACKRMKDISASPRYSRKHLN
jgi:hypothetical protein